MITHIILNLPEEYQTIVEILEEKLDYEYNTSTLDKIRDKISVKYNQMNK